MKKYIFLTIITIVISNQSSIVFSMEEALAKESKCKVMSSKTFKLINNSKLENSKLQEFKKLIEEKEIDVNQPTCHGETLINIICSTNNLAAVDILLPHCSPKTINLEMPSLFNQVNSPLMWACRFENDDMANHLISFGAVVKQKHLEKAQSTSLLKLLKKHLTE